MWRTGTFCKQFSLIWTRVTCQVVGGENICTNSCTFISCEKLCWIWRSWGWWGVWAGGQGDSVGWWQLACTQVRADMFSSLREESSFHRIEEADYGFSSLQPRQYGVRVARRKAIFESLSSDISSNTSTSSESSPRLARKPFNASCRNFLAFQTKERVAKNKHQSSTKFTSFHTSDLKVSNKYFPTSWGWAVSNMVTFRL